MEATLREKLISLEQHSLLALLSRDEEALEEISREWSQLSSHIKAVEANGKLDDKTALLLSHVSGPIANVTRCMLESEDILQDAQSYLINLLSHETPPNPLELSTRPSPISPYHLLFSHQPSSEAALGQHKALDAYAYHWLMQNFHNPYPTTLQMQILSDMSGTTVAQVQIWFEKTRDSIGWTKLSHELFASSPGATVAAAKRVYLERNNDVPFDVIFAFTAVKASAETHFLEHPALQEKHFSETWTFPDTPEAQVHCMNPGGVFIPDTSLPLDEFSYIPSSDESEEEDTTPPPPMAGHKRHLIEDVLTLEDSDLVRPPKRYRTWPVIEGGLSKQAYTAPAPSNIGPLAEHNNARSTTPTVTERSTNYTGSDPLHVMSSTHSHGASPTCHKRDRPELDNDMAENFGSFTDVPPHPKRRRKVLETTSPLPFKEVYSSPITPGDHLPPDSSPPSGGCSGHSSHHPLHTVLEPVSIVSNVPSNLCVFDWNSIPIPLQDAVSTPSPVYSYVPSSNLPESNLQLPNPSGLGHQLSAGLSPPCSVGNLPSFGELNCLSPSTVSNPSSTLLYSETPSILQGIDWPSLAEFIDQPSASAQSSSQISLPTTSITPSSQEGSLSFPLPASCGIDRFVSLLDPSTPPSAVLSAELDAFAMDAHMWPLLYGVS